MRRQQFVLLTAFALGLLCSAARAVDNTTVNTSFYLSPDGVLMEDTIPPTQGTGNNAGTPQWFVFWVEAQRSYVFEVISKGVYFVNTPPQPIPTFFEGDGTTPLASVTLTAINFCDPRSGNFAQTPVRRFSLVNNSDTAKFVTVRITSGLNFQTVEDSPFAVRLVDTTLASARWTTNGYNSFVTLHNRSACAATYVMIFYDEAGTNLLTLTGSIPGRGSTQISKPGNDPVVGAKKGSVEVLLGGVAAGDVLGGVIGLNPVTNGFLQFSLERRGYATP